MSRTRSIVLYAGTIVALAAVPAVVKAKKKHAEKAESAAEADGGIEPEGGVGGYAVERMESELSIHVPDDQVAAVWQYLQSTYGSPQDWPEGVDPHVLSARLSDESFIDRYYDTPTLEVLAGKNGVRWRSRDIPGAPDDPKDDRQLVQVKVTSAGDTVTRGEYKFPVKASVSKRGAGGRSVAELVRDKYRKPFEKLVSGIGADPKQLEEVLRLDQHRRRVYFSDGKGPMMTITLDQVTAHRWWAAAPWTEMEIEIGEVRYTEATPEERQVMERVRGALRADVFRHFPTLFEDDAPKYGEAFARLEKHLPMMRKAIALRDSVVPVSVASIGVLALLGLGVSFNRRRREASA